MTKVLEFCQSPANPFEKLVRQEQLLHCTSIHAHLNSPRVKVNVEVKTTIKQLSLYLVNDAIRSKGRINNSELPLDAVTPLFLPNKSYLVDLLIHHIHHLIIILGCHRHCHCIDNDAGLQKYDPVLKVFSSGVCHARE